MVFVISNKNPDKRPRVRYGESFPHTCGETHVLFPAISEGKPDNSLLWYKCGERTMLGAVNGKLVAEVKQ